MNIQYYPSGAKQGIMKHNSQTQVVIQWTIDFV